MNRHYKALELDKILKMLADETTCEDSRVLAEQLEPETNLKRASALLKETDDAYVLIGRFGTPSFGGVKNVTNSLRRAEAGGCLTASELLKISETLRIIRSLKEWRSKSAGIETSLDFRFEGLSPNKFLEDKINTCILSEEEIADNASSTLYDIRRKIRTASSKAREILDKIIHSSTYQKYLQDFIVTQRDGRFVVPVKAECRGNVPGLVHDTSSSGATIFIEPMGVVQANNDIKVLQDKEADEIERILFELSALAGGFADSISGSYHNLVDLNLIFAKANLGYKMNAVVPELNDRGIIDLKNARHPLIAKDKVVPTDISLGKDFDTLVITGPNTGGKTVSLKTIGLLSLMAMCGLMTPCRENSKLSVFKKILVDIGDEQSIEQSLSTFSAHMTNIIDIIKVADRSSLCLVDELGAGTDPVEGAALAISILEKLRFCGSKIAATTHYAELKAYALKTRGVENGCCEFDVATLRPTYKLLIGVPGKSNAFAISKRLGLDADIVARAKELVSEESREFETVVETLENRRQTLEQKMKEADRLKSQARREREEAIKERKLIQEQAEKEIEKAKAEAQAITAKTRAEAYALLDEIEKIKKQKSAADAESKAKLKKSIKSMEDHADPVAKSADNSGYTLPRPLKVGDTVLIYDIDKKGTVLSLPDKNGNVQVQAGIIKTRVKLSNLRLVEEAKVTTTQTRKPRTVTKNVDIHASTEIDVRGMTAIEAIMEVESAIDSALLSNVNTLTIIHGKGTGVLRKEIQMHLKRNKYVKSYRLGVFGEGESGVTIVELK